MCFTLLYTECKRAAYSNTLLYIICRCSTVFRYDVRIYGNTLYFLRVRFPAGTQVFTRRPERGPLSLVRIIEELLEWKSSGSYQENRINGRGIRCADHATPISAKVGTNFAD
jgi:hypothetical protein